MLTISALYPNFQGKKERVKITINNLETLGNANKTKLINHHVYHLLSHFNDQFIFSPIFKKFRAKSRQYISAGMAATFDISGCTVVPLQSVNHKHLIYI